MEGVAYTKCPTPYHLLWILGHGIERRERETLTPCQTMASGGLRGGEMRRLRWYVKVDEPLIQIWKVDLYDLLKQFCYILLFLKVHRFIFQETYTRITCG